MLRGKEKQQDMRPDFLRENREDWMVVYNYLQVHLRFGLSFPHHVFFRARINKLWPRLSHYLILVNKVVLEHSHARSNL